MAVIGKKKKKTRENKSRVVENEIELEPTKIQKKQSYLILLEHSFHLNLAELIFLKQFFI